jgi:hypothetical protein
MQMIRPVPRAFVRELHQCAGGDDLAQRRILLSEPRGEIDDAGIGHGAVFRCAVDGVGGEAGSSHV